MLKMLHYLAATYFHQDYDLDADTPLGVVELFMRDTSRSYSVTLLAELEELLASGLDEESAERIWMQDCLSSYDPAIDRLSYVDWLKSVRDLLKAALAESR